MHKEGPMDEYSFSGRTRRLDRVIVCLAVAGSVVAALLGAWAFAVVLLSLGAS